MAAATTTTDETIFVSTVIDTFDLFVEDDTENKSNAEINKKTNKQTVDTFFFGSLFIT